MNPKSIIDGSVPCTSLFSLFSAIKPPEKGKKVEEKGSIWSETVNYPTST